MGGSLTETGVPDGRTARIAGLLYLVVVVTGVFSLAYVPGRMPAGAAATVAWLQDHELLFRQGIAAALVCNAAFLVLPLALYRLLGHVDRQAATLMVAFAVAGVPVALLNTANLVDVLSIVADPRPGQAGGELAGVQLMRALSDYKDGLLICELFWGLWLFPFGYLVFRSGFLPKALGALLMLACLGYMIDLFGDLLFRGYAASGVGRWVTLPRLGEIIICLWLLILGVKIPAAAAKTSPA